VREVALHRDKTKRNDVEEILEEHRTEAKPE
jgi:hypothetical protein